MLSLGVPRCFCPNTQRTSSLRAASSVSALLFQSTRPRFFPTAPPDLTAWDAACQGDFRKHAARAGIGAILKAVAYTKLYQAASVQAVAAIASTVEIVSSTSSLPRRTADTLLPPAHSPEVCLAPPPSSQLYAELEVGNPAVQPATPVTTAFSLAVENALLTEEIGILRTAQSSLVEQLHQTPYAPTMANSHIADAGPEWCPFTAQLESAAAVVQLQDAVLEAVHTRAVALASLSSQSSFQVWDNSDCEQSLQATRKSLQVLWRKVNYETTYLQVRMAQQQQLPAQPRRHVTMRLAQQSVSTALRARLEANQHTTLPHK